MSDVSGGEEDPGRGDMIAYKTEDGHDILVSSSFGNPDIVSCSVLLTREKAGAVPKEWRKEVVANALLGTLRSAGYGEAHVIHTIRKFSKNQSAICVRFGLQASADALLALKTVKVLNELCTVTQYGEIPIRIQLARVPLAATVEEVVNVVKHLGTVLQITRPLIQGYEDHLVSILLMPSQEANFVEEQNKVLRSAIFGGQTHTIQYRCLSEIVVCSACKEKGHFNGQKCPMINRCFSCNQEGHKSYNCPSKVRAPNRNRDNVPPHALPEEQRKQPAPMPGKPPAPPPPPADASALQSTGLPSLGGSTWGSFDPGVSEIEMRPSKSPLERDYRSSTRSIVSDERQARLEKAIRGGKIHSEALREKMKEKKRRDKEAKMKNHGSVPGLMMQCVSQSSQDEIPQTDGPIDSPTATSHMSEPSEIVEAADDSSTDDTGTDDGEKYTNKKLIFKDYGEWKIQEIIDNQHKFFCCECGEKGCPNLCITCPIFPTTWCSKEHKCVTAQSQLAAFSMDVTDIPPCSYCGLIGMHTCVNDNCKLIPNVERC